MRTAETHTRGEDPRKPAGWVGSLSDTPLAEVFQRIVQEGRSGDLRVEIPDAVKTVYFDRGFVVLASSSLLSDRLGESMIEAGRISRHEFALASMVMKASRRKFGETLVEAGIVSEEELGQHVAAQVNRIVLSLFSSRTGSYRFDQHPCTVPVELMVSLSVYRILLEGVRRMTRKRLVLAGLPPLETRMRIVSELPFNLDVDHLRPVEKDVLKAARNGASIEGIAKSLGGDEGVVLRAVYGLYCAGVLEPAADETRNQRLRIQEETGTFVLSEIRSKVEARRSPPAPARPAPIEKPGKPEKLEEPEKPEPPAEPVPAAESQPREQNANPMLRKVQAALSPLGDRIERALLRWVGSHAADVEATEPAPVRPAEPPKPQRATPAMEEATATMEEDAGVVELVEPEPVEPEPVETRDPTIEQIGVPSWSMRDGPELEVESAGAEPEAAPLLSLDNEFFIEGESFTDEAPSMLSQIPVEEVDVELEPSEPVAFEGLSAEVEVPVVEAVEVETEEAQPARDEAPEVPDAPEAAEVLEVIDAPEVTEVAAAPEVIDAEESPETHASPPLATAAEGPAPSREDPLADRAEAMRRAKLSGGEARLLRDVKLHFKLQDWEGAVPLLEQLVLISPGSALYRGMLARAMSRHPLMRKDAEEHFIEALRLAPHDAELHYWLGLYYKSFGLKARAETEFRTTLRIDPRHQGARTQLEGRKDDAIGTVFKKLFG